jgi:ABC-type uncharacterized transport system involved in gliding motility auxiliary subunit
MVGILILVNFIAQKEPFRWDLTKSKKYSLSDQTIKVVEAIDEEVKVIGFFQSNNSQKSEVEDLLEEYKAKNDKLKIEFIDPDVKPAEARRYGIARYGTLIFEQGDKQEQSLTATESDITSSLLKLSREGEKVIYFLAGHNEKDIEGMAELGYSNVKDLLEREGYVVKKLSLVTEKKIPDDAEVLVVSGPKQKYLDKEVKILEKYLMNGGKMMAMLDPSNETEKGSNLKGLLKKWGVEIEDGVVIDPTKYFWTDVGSPVIDDWQNHQITSSISPAFFSGVMKVGEASEHPENVEISSLAQTSQDSWLEKNLDSGQAKFNESDDIKGPISIAMVVQGIENEEDETNKEENKEEENKNKSPRIVVIGDSDFANNIFADSLGNFDFFVNSIDWLAEEEDLISIRPKDQENRTVTLTGAQSKLVFYLTVIGMPLIIIIIGVGVWMDRRRKRQRKR